MAALAGYGGSVKVGSNVVAQINNWEVQINDGLLDTTVFGSQWKTSLGGVRDWSGKFGGFWDQTDINGQAALQTALLAGTTVTLTFLTNGTNGYTGTAYLKSMDIKADEMKTVDCDFSYQGTGALTTQ